MVKIKVAYTGTKLDGFNGEGLKSVKLPEEATIKDLAEELMLPQDLFLIYIVGGVLVKTDHKLKNGDVVEIFSPMVGG